MTTRHTQTTLSPDDLSLLEICPLFVGVARELLDKTFSSSLEIKLQKEDKLLVPGQINRYVYIVLSGRLGAKRDESDSNPITMYGQGECVGEMSMLGDRHASTFVVAATDCKLLGIELATLWGLIDVSHKAATNLLRVLGQHVQVNERLTSESLENSNGYQAIDMVDGVTGLYNQHWMRNELGRYLKRCFLESRRSCLIMLEIDGYQNYIEKYGALGGDQALRTFAGIMLSCLRPEDLAGRYSGSKFVIFLPYTTTMDAARIAAERLRLAISNAVIVLPSGDALPHITASLGLCQLRDEGLSEFLARAEAALQDAKSSGGNCLKFID